MLGYNERGFSHALPVDDGGDMFDSVEDVQQRFKNARYIANRRIATVVYLAERMGRPVLIEGPAGVGKTELAKTLADITSRPLIRLQCYEGLDEGKALYEWKYAKQLLYTQLLKERIGELIADAPSLPDAVARIAGQDDAFFSYRFLSPRPLLSAIQSESPVVLLIDEIDKAEPEFEAFLLEVLSDFQVSVPELGTVKARHVPLVVLTSNNARELSDGLKRRCLHLFIDFPAPAEELEIIRLKVPEIPERLARAVVAAVQKIRTLELRKPPSVSESLDWARSLVILNARQLDAALVESTLTMLVKYEKDLERVKSALDKVLAEST
jgi:MoxR-like ATPase